MADYLSISYEKLTEKDKFNSIAICAKYDEAKEIIAELVCSGYGIASIDKFDSKEYGGYKDEYVISLLEGQIWCEPAKHGDKYVDICANKLFLMGNCNSKMLNAVNSECLYIIDIYDHEECNDCYLDECSNYYINDKKVTKEEYEQAIQDVSGFLKFVSKIWDFI